MCDAVQEAGGTVSAGVPLTHAAPPVAAPFASAKYVEHPNIQAVDLGAPDPSPEQVGFLDGIQRYAVEGRIGLVPVVRGYVAAAVLRRDHGALRAADSEAEEFVVVPLARLDAAQRDALRRTGLELIDCEAAERSHPILDVQLAAKVVEERRETLERRVARRHLATSGDAWLVVDGSVTDLVGGSDAQRVLGVIKSHETQFLEGADLDVALTLPAHHRTSVFARSGRRATVYTWYLRLWPWEEHELLHGLVRLERAAIPETVTEATAVSRWVLGERAPLAARDGRWDRLIYPVQQVETYLRAQVGGWW